MEVLSADREQSQLPHEFLILAAVILLVWKVKFSGERESEAAMCPARLPQSSSMNVSMDRPKPFRLVPILRFPL